MIGNPETMKGRLKYQSNVKQKVNYNRVHLLSQEDAKELNTYLNFGVFPTFADTFVPEYDTATKDNYKQSGLGTPGVRSLFNRAGAVILGSTPESSVYEGIFDPRNGDSTDAHWWRIGNNVPLMDSPKARQRIRRSSGCSIKELVRDSEAGIMGQETYAYSDFMYCKHLGKVSNNYMITLRRFPLPVDDYIGCLGEDITVIRDADGIINQSSLDLRLSQSAKNASCIGCMVTWMGVSGNELSNILKYNYKMPFKEEEANWESGQAADADQNTGALSSMFSIFDEQYVAQYQSGYASTSGNAAFKYLGLGGLGEAPYKNLAGLRDERTKVWGPIDSIRHVYLRDDKGLTFQQKITLVFEYELRSYNGINGKQAMLDLISNILNVTYTTGSFWGGGHKGFGAHQSNIFANLNIFKARGGFTNFVDAFAVDLQNVSNKISDYIDKNGGAVETLKSLLNQLGGMVMSGILNKLGRPQKGFYNALLSPAPIGFWHVTIGNPKRPIMSIGNMVITNVQLEHTGPLGIDDFPTGLKVTVELDRGKARDLRDIERLYMQGNDRIYSSMGDKVFDMYKNAKLYKKYKDANQLEKYTKDELSKDSNSAATINLFTPTEFDNDKDFVKEGKNKGELTTSGKDKVAAEQAALKNHKSVTVADLELKKFMRKYFGTEDEYSIFIPAAEQEYGAGKKKPSTAANKNAEGGN